MLGPDANSISAIENYMLVLAGSRGREAVEPNGRTERRRSDFRRNSSYRVELIGFFRLPRRVRV